MANDQEITIDKDKLKTVVECCELSLAIQIDFFMYFYDSMCTHLFLPENTYFLMYFTVNFFIYRHKKEQRLDASWLVQYSQSTD